ncbi:hypothetical protein [uncultured Methanobrevibacter sp.]|uniref:hypothetical protein n=1 Tax=uncultured Methanobrevibacter sp. TaxID=253161 RepID=UPI0025CC6B42|nr:hypothetical protein [uncultured Methanobrevibacter sp.]
MFNKWSQIYCEDNSTIYADYIIFTNCSSAYAPAFYFKTSNSKIINSRFINLKGNITCGAIGNIGAGSLYIKNCEFINTRSSKNGGAIYVDSSNVIILDSIFNNATSRIRGH